MQVRLEPTYRLYQCQRCDVQVRICCHCDHGNIYCAGECAQIRRRESLRRAGARYQRTSMRDDFNTATMSRSYLVA